MCTTEPTRRSAGLTGRPWGSVTSRMPARQMVVERLLPGSGPVSRSRTTAGSGTRASAPMSELRISGRRPSPDSAAPSWRMPTASPRSTSDPRSRCRSSTRSSSGIRVLAQWTAPAPIPNSARKRPIPRPSVDNRVRASRSKNDMFGLSNLIVKYTTRVSRVPIALIPNRVATWRSARLAAAGSTSAMRCRWGTRPGFSNRSVTTAPRASWGRTPSWLVAPSRDAGVVPLMTCSSWATASGVRGCQPAGSRRCRGWPSGWPSRRRSGWWSRRLRPEPHGAADQGRDADHPGDQTLVDRAEEAEAEATGGRLLLGGLEVGDDVALVLRGHGLVVEDRHRLGAGEHRLVDVRGARAVEVRGVLAAGQRAALAGEVVAHRAVRPEDRGAARGVTLRCGDVGLRGDRRAGPEARDVGRKLNDLLGSYPVVALRALRRVLAQRH